MMGHFGVTAIVHDSSKYLTIYQTSTAIYEFLYPLSKLVHKLANNLNDLINCDVLFMDKSRQILLSICE